MRLIDADALPRHGQRGGLVHWQDIENAPTIDAVEVVRCKNCFFYDPLDSKRPFTCERSNMTVTETDYCSFGERRTGYER